MPQQQAQGIQIPSNAPPYAVALVANIERYFGERSKAPVFLPTFNAVQLDGSDADDYLNPADWAGCAVRCPDDVGGATIAVSSGTVWERVRDGAPITP